MTRSPPRIALALVLFAMASPATTAASVPVVSAEIRPCADRLASALSPLEALQFRNVEEIYIVVLTSTDAQNASATMIAHRLAPEMGVVKYFGSPHSRAGPVIEIEQSYMRNLNEFVNVPTRLPDDGRPTKTNSAPAIEAAHRLTFTTTAKKHVNPNGFNRRT